MWFGHKGLSFHQLYGQPEAVSQAGWGKEEESAREEGGPLEMGTEAGGFSQGIGWYQCEGGQISQKAQKTSEFWFWFWPRCRGEKEEEKTPEAQAEQTLKKASTGVWIWNRRGKRWKRLRWQSREALSSGAKSQAPQGSIRFANWSGSCIPLS